VTTGLYAEDVVVGEEVVLGAYSFTAGQIIAFGERFDPLPFHTDPDYAASTEFGGLIASGAHTMAVFQRLAVDAVWSRFERVVGRRMAFRMLRPVRPGNTLSGTLRWEGVKLRDDGRAVVEMSAELVDEQGRPVFAVAGDVVITRRPGF
jgi:acyl dehydratase